MIHGTAEDAEIAEKEMGVELVELAGEYFRVLG
jgi:hypothetical protein